MVSPACFNFEWSIIKNLGTGRRMDLTRLYFYVVHTKQPSFQIKANKENLKEMFYMLLTQTMQEINRQSNPSFIVIEPEITQQAIIKDMISEPVAVSKNGNVYYEILGSTDSMLMYVQNNKHIVINGMIPIRKIDDGQGQEEFQFEYLVDKLKNFSFVTRDGGKGSRERVIWGVTKAYEHLGVTQMPIERVMMSFMLNSLLVRLPSYMHIHHKCQTWDNRPSTTMYIHRKDHIPHKGHLSGRYIDSIDKMSNLIDEIQSNEINYKNVDWVA